MRLVVNLFVYSYLLLFIIVNVYSSPAPLPKRNSTTKTYELNYCGEWSVQLSSNGKYYAKSQSSQSEWNGYYIRNGNKVHVVEGSGNNRPWLKWSANIDGSKLVLDK